MDLPFQRFTRNVIEYITQKTHAEQPTVGRCSSPLENGVGPCIDGLITPLRRILILLIRFRMPTTAVVHSEDAFNFVGNFKLSIITDQFTHSSPKSDNIFQNVDNLHGGMHGVHIRDQGVITNKKFGP